MTTASAPHPIDLLIHARWVIPVEPRGVVLENHALAIQQGCILDLIPSADADQRYHATATVRLEDHVLIPGLINLHTHAAMALMRGFADDLPLMRWLQERIWPAEGAHMSPDFVRDGTLLGAAEMLRGGITCFQDMYFYPEAAAEAAIEAGIRAVLGIVTLEFPTRYASDADDYLTKGLAARDRYRQEATIDFTLAPHAPYTVSDRTFERIVTLSAQLDLPIHLHLHETRSEIEESIKIHGVRPIERLHQLRVIGPDLIAAHAVHLDPSEIDLLATQGCHLAHCPTSNMKLASGIAPIADALAHGINIGLGTDGCASNNRLDLFQEMRHAALLGKVTSGDAAALQPHDVLRMATLNGATALGLEGLTGSLIPGKQADLCAIRLDEWMVKPLFDPASHLIYVAGRENVSDVWVNGIRRVANGQLVNIDHSKLSSIASLWQNRLMS